MPRYFFHTNDHEDPIGAVYETITDAKCQASLYAGRLLCDRATGFWPAAEINVTVSDASGLTLFMITIHGIEAPAVRASMPPASQPS